MENLIESGFINSESEDKTIHKVTIGKGRTTDCGRFFTSTQKGFSINFSTDKSEVTCTKCLNIKTKPTPKNGKKSSKKRA